MKKLNFGQFLLLLLFISFSFFSCEKENENSRLSEKNQVITFAYDCMSTYYLWNKNVPALNLKNEANTDPYAYFEKIRYVDDHWSMLTDDVKSLSESLSGTGTTFGYSLALGTFSDDPDNVFAVVLFTYPGSPAEIAGLKRGDFIIGMNDRPITRDNYTDLFYASNLNLNLGYLQGETVYSGGSVSLQARNMYLNPVNKYKIIEKGNHKIGYLFYTDFLLQSHNELQNVFDYFKQNNVTFFFYDIIQEAMSLLPNCWLPFWRLPQPFRAKRFLTKRSGTTNGRNISDKKGSTAIAILPPSLNTKMIMESR